MQSPGEVSPPRRRGEKYLKASTNLGDGNVIRCQINCLGGICQPRQVLPIHPLPHAKGFGASLLPKTPVRKADARQQGQACLYPLSPIQHTSCLRPARFESNAAPVLATSRLFDFPTLSFPRRPLPLVSQSFPSRMHRQTTPARLEMVFLMDSRVFPFFSLPSSPLMDGNNQRGPTTCLR